MATAAKLRTKFLCRQCGSLHPKWMGKCPDCGAWDTLDEVHPQAADDRQDRIAGAVSRRRGTADLVRGAQPVRLDEIDGGSAPRIPSGIGEFDRVLGGGLVPGMAVLVGGEPGIGKSTLLLQAAAKWASGERRSDEATERRRGQSTSAISAEAPASSGRSVGGPASSRAVGANDAVSGDASSGLSDPTSLRRPVASSLPVLYVTSEESAAQTRLRAKRLGIDSPSLLVLAETNLDRIVHQIGQSGAAVVVIDSIQMVYKPDVPAAPGSVTQLRDCCMDLVYLAKQTGACIIVVGHVTKAGTLAGPKIIEHIVDTVIYFEGDRFHAHRIVRCVKNRFGGTHEVGLFEMGDRGLVEVVDPGKLFAEQYGGENPPSGSVLTATMQGSRTLLVEVQALTAASVIGAARRKVSGFSSDRTAMIIAVLEKRGDLKLAADDVFVNVAGGVKITEPAADLAVALAIASAHYNRPLPPGTVALGELGLGGEVRPVSQLEARLKEAARLGATQAIVPHLGGRKLKLGGMALYEVRRLSQAIGEVL